MVSKIDSWNEISGLEAKVAEHEKSIRLLEERLAGAAQIVFQMDEFLRKMLQAGHFEQTIQAIKNEENLN